MHRFLRGFLAFSAVALTSVSALADEGYGRPVDISLNGHMIDWLNVFCTWAIGILFVIMVGFLGIAIVQHRDGKHKAKYDHGSTMRDLLLIAAVAGAIFFAVDGTMLAKSYAELA